MRNVSTASLMARPASKLLSPAVRPLYSALGSERGQLMPPLEDAMARYLHLRAQSELEDAAGLDPLQGRM